MKQREQQDRDFGAERPKGHLIHKLCPAIMQDVFKAVIIVLIIMFSSVNTKTFPSQHKGTRNQQWLASYKSYG